MNRDLTTILEVKDQLFQLLKQALAENPATSGVPVGWGTTSGDELVVIYTAESDSQFATLGGPVPALDENFQIQLLVEATVASGRDLRPAEERMWEIAQVVGEAIRDHGLIGPRCLFTRPASVRQEYFQTDKRQGSRARITLAGKARI